MLFAFFVIFVILVFVLAAGKYKNIRKHNYEITNVEIIAISGRKFTFAVHYGDEIKYESWNIDSARYNDLMQYVKY